MSEVRRTTLSLHRVRRRVLAAPNDPLLFRRYREIDVSSADVRPARISLRAARPSTTGPLGRQAARLYDVATKAFDQPISIRPSRLVRQKCAISQALPRPPVLRTIGTNELFHAMEERSSIRRLPAPQANGAYHPSPIQVLLPAAFCYPRCYPGLFLTSSLPLKTLATPVGFEPTTCRLEGGCSRPAELRGRTGRDGRLRGQINSRFYRIVN